MHLLQTLTQGGTIVKPVENLTIIKPLRILAIHGVKITKKQTPWHVLLVQIFERQSGCKINKQNVSGDMIVAPCIASILKPHYEK